MNQPKARRPEEESIRIRRYPRVGSYTSFYLPLFNCRTNRSSKNCAGSAFFASGTDSERKFNMPTSRL